MELRAWPGAKPATRCTPYVRGFPHGNTGVAVPSRCAKHRYCFMSGSYGGGFHSAVWLSHCGPNRGGWYMSVCVGVCVHVCVCMDLKTLVYFDCFLIGLMFLICFPKYVRGVEIQARR